MIDLHPNASETVQAAHAAAVKAFSNNDEFQGALLVESLRARESALASYSVFLEAALLDSTDRFRTLMERAASDVERASHTGPFNVEQGTISREIASNDIDLMSVRMQIRRAEAGR